jgi:hypothetical protein
MNIIYASDKAVSPVPLQRREVYSNLYCSTVLYRTIRASVANRMVQRRESNTTHLRFQIYVDITLDFTVQPNNEIFNKLARTDQFCLLY